MKWKKPASLLGQEQALADPFHTGMVPSGTIQKGWRFSCSWSTCHFYPGCFVNFVEPYLIHLGSQVRWELRGEFWLCLEVFVGPCKSAHCILLGRARVLQGGGWCGAEGALPASCMGTGMDCTEGRGCSPGEHRGRGGAGQAMVEATWATGARKESCGLVKGMNSFLLLSVPLALVCTFPGLKTAPGSRWGPSSGAPLTFVAITNCSSGCNTVSAGGISWEFHLTGMKGCLLGLAN